MKQLITYFLSLLFGTAASAQTTSDLVQKYGKKFPELTELSIALIKEKDNIEYQGFVKKDTLFESKENSKSVFEIGSVSKVFTSTLLAHQVQKGKLKLDQPVKSLLHFKLKGNPPITLQQLANHTSGLPRLPENIMPLLRKDPDNPYKDYDEEKLKEYCSKELKLQSEVGKKSEYSNLGAGLLGYALSQHSKKSYEKLLQENIFQPLKMQHSTTNRDLVKNRLVLGLNPSGKPTSNWDMAVLAPAGGILSTVEDLSKFAIANLDSTNQVFNLQRLSTFTINKSMSIALGWHLITTQKGYQFYWHNGGTGGYTSFLAIDVQKGCAVVILSNVSAFHPNMSNLDALGVDLLGILQELE